jgi:hypothetical protein
MKLCTYQSNNEDVEAILAHLGLNVDKSGIRNSLGINLKSLEGGQLKSVIAEYGLTHVTEVFKVFLIAGNLHATPGLLRKHIGNEIQVKLAVGLAINCLVAFKAAIPANIGRTIGAIDGRVALLLTNTARSSKDTGVRAVGLGVAGVIRVVSNFKIKALECSLPFLATVETSSLTRLGAFSLTMAIVCVSSEERTRQLTATCPSSPQLKQARFSPWPP